MMNNQRIIRHNIQFVKLRAMQRTECRMGNHASEQSCFE